MERQRNVPISALDVNRPLTQARAMYPVLGRAGFELLNSGLGSEDQVNEILFGGVAEAYEIPPHIDTKRYMKEIAAQADVVMNNLVDRIFPNNGHLVRPNPDFLRAMQLNPSAALDNTFENNRRLLIMHGLIQHGLRSERLDFPGKRQELDYVLTQLIPDPNTVAHAQFYSRHHPDTLETIDLCKTLPEANGEVIKQHEFEVFEVPGIGWVTTWTREKDPTDVVLKAAENSLSPKSENYNNGYMNINRQVRDPVGGIILVDEDENMEPIMELAKQKLEQHFGERLDRIEEDHHTNNDRGSTVSHEDDTGFYRLQVYLKEMKARHPGEVDERLEVIIDSAKRYIGRILHRGTVDPKTKLYNGRGESLYRIRRIAKTAGAFVAPELQDIVLTELPYVSADQAEELKKSPGLVRPRYCDIKRDSWK